MRPLCIPISSIIFFILLTPLLGANETSGITIGTEFKTIETDAREMVPIVFSVTNNSDQVFFENPSILLPPGWELSFPPMPLSVASGSSDVVFLTPFIPSNTPAGTYEVGISFFEGAIKSIVSVVIKPQYNIVFSTVSRPLYVFDQKTYEIGLRITNSGNATSTVRISGTSNYSKNTSFDRDVITLKPSESEEVTYRVIIDKDLKGRTIEFSTFEAIILEEPSIIVSYKESIEIIPSVPLSAMYHYYKIALESKLSSTLAGNISTLWETTLKGSGSIDDKHIHNISFTLPTINMKELSFVDPLTSTTFKYSSPISSISINASSFTLLSDIPSISSRGILGTITLPLFSCKTFFTIENPQESQIGLLANFNFSDVNGVSFGYKNDKLLDIDFLGISGFIRPYNSANIHLDGTIAIQDPAMYSISFSMEAKEKFYQYSLAYGYKSASMVDSDSGEQKLSISTTINPSQRFTFSGAYRRNHENFDFDMSGTTSTVSQVFDFSTSFFSRGGWGVSLSMRRNTFEDIMNPTLRNLLQDSYSLSFNTTFSDIKIHTTITHYQSNDIATSLIENHQTIRISGEKRSQKGESTTATFSYNTGQTIPGLLDGRFMAQLSTQIRINKVFVPSFSSSFQISPLNPQNYSLSFSTNASYSSEQFGSITGSLNYERAVEITTFNSLSVTLTYSRSLSVKLGKRSDVSSLKGQIIPYTEGQVISKALITIGGQTTISDERGFFTFNALPQGEHVITITSTDLLNPIMFVNDEQRIITIENDTSYDISIEVSTPRTIKGIVRIQKIDDETSIPFLGVYNFTPPVGYSGALVEIESEYGVFRALVRKDGSFSFSGLVATKWTIRLLDSTIPDGHTLTISEEVIDLGSADASGIEILLTPEIKQIQFLQGGDFIEIN